MYQIDVKIVINKKKYLKCSFRPSFKREKQLDNGLMIKKDNKKSS